MSKSDSKSLETYVTDRYELWRDADISFAYKRKKGLRIAQIVRETGGLPPRALELGVGPGGVAVAMSQSGVRMTGIDLSLDALQIAREHCRGQKVSLLRGSGFSLPFADGTFPLVYASQVLHLFEEEGRLALLTEVRRVLQPHGRFVFDMKNIASHPVRYLRSSARRKRRNFPSPEHIQELLRRTHYSDVEVRAGVVPFVGPESVPDGALFRAIAHTRFFIARRS